MNRVQYCRLCMSTLDPTNIDNYLNIFSVIGIEMKMNEIISEHFNCEISEFDSLPNYVCQVCWHITENFHALYLKSKTVQEKFQNPPIKVESDVNESWHINQETHFIEEFEIGPIKTELNLDELDLAADIAPNTHENSDDNEHGDFADNTYDSDENSENEEVVNKKIKNKKSNGKINGKKSNKKDSTKKSSQKPPPPDEKNKKTRRAMRESRARRDKEFDEFLYKHRDLLKMDCDLCPTVFKNLYDARKHYAQEHNNPKGYIKCCSAKFYVPSQVMDHIKKHVEPKSSKNTQKYKIVTCDLCTKTFSRKTSLRSHMKRHINEINQLDDVDQTKFIQEHFDLKCDFCDTVFGGYYDARRHYSSIHNEDKGYIKCCKMKLREPWMVRDHIRSHLEPECFKCDICNKSFKTRVFLWRHKRRHQNKTLEKALICDYCEKRCRDKVQLTRHMFTKHVFLEPKYECEVCHKKFQLSSLLKLHSYSHQDNFFGICEICGKSFHRKCILESHKLTHKDKSQRLAEAKQCEHCGEWLLTKGRVYYHEQIHTSGPQKCKHCQMELPNKMALQGHIRFHHRAHKYKCSFCAKTFENSFKCKTHEESHTRHKTYACRFCDKTFTVASSLSTHMGRNHREKRNESKKIRDSEIIACKSQQ